jgi:hypothetical protein
MEDYYECGDGWIPLIEEAKTIVSKYNLKHPDSDNPLEFTQIKEKWGGLCLYLNYYVPEVSHRIRALEHKSFEICEQCGTNKNVECKNTHGWIMTLCNKCREEELQNYYKRFNNVGSKES